MMSRDVVFIPITELTTEHRISGASVVGNEVLSIRETAKRIYFTYRYTTVAGDVREVELYQDKDTKIAVRRHSHVDPDAALEEAQIAARS